MMADKREEDLGMAPDRPAVNRRGNPNVIDKRLTHSERNVKLQRLDIVARLWKRGYGYREIRDEVMKRLNLPTYSLGTVSRDVKTLLTEWQENRLDNMDNALDLELQRIDDLVKEAWSSWEQSKEDYLREKTKLKGTPAYGGGDDGSSVKTRSVEKTTENMRSVGDPRFIDTINKLLQERRKLLGLYAPEKQDVKTDFSFADLLMRTGQRKE